MPPRSIRPGAFSKLRPGTAAESSKQANKLLLPVSANARCTQTSKPQRATPFCTQATIRRVGAHGREELRCDGSGSALDRLQQSNAVKAVRYAPVAICCTDSVVGGMRGSSPTSAAPSRASSKLSAVSARALVCLRVRSGSGRVGKAGPHASTARRGSGRRRGSGARLVRCVR